MPDRYRFPNTPAGEALREVKVTSAALFGDTVERGTEENFAGTKFTVLYLDVTRRKE